MTKPKTLRRRGQLERIWEAQGKCCFLCGEKMFPVSRKNVRLGWTFDHVRPQSKGHSRIGNVLVAHAGCNRDKGDREPTACELMFLDTVNTKIAASQSGIGEAWKRYIEASRP